MEAEIDKVLAGGKTVPDACVSIHEIRAMLKRMVDGLQAQNVRYETLTGCTLYTAGNLKKWEGHADRSATSRRDTVVALMQYNIEAHVNDRRQLNVDRMAAAEKKAAAGDAAEAKKAAAEAKKAAKAEEMANGEKANAEEMMKLVRDLCGLAITFYDRIQTISSTHRWNRTRGKTRSAKPAPLMTPPPPWTLTKPKKTPPWATSDTASTLQPHK